MASDKPQSKILDLLYDDELDAAARQEARREVEQSDEARRELDSFESLLSRLRDADLEEEVPSSLHDSIMAAAREHTAKKASRQAQVTERAPTPSTPKEKSLWSRLNSSGATQLALAAAVVLVGGFIFIQLADKAPKHKFNAAESAVSNHVTFGGESKDFAKMEPASQPTDDYAAAPAEETPNKPAEETQNKQVLNDSDAEEVDEEMEEELAVRPPARDKAAVGELAQLDTKRAEATRAEAKAPRRAREDRAAASPKKKMARKSRSRTKASDDTFDLMDDDGRSSVGSSRQLENSKPEPNRNTVEDRFASAEAADTQQPALLEGDEVNNDSATLGKSLGALAQKSERSATSSQSMGSTRGAAKGTASKPAPAQVKRDQQAQQTSQVSAMETSYRSGNYAGVVTQADRYLSRPGGDKADEARVLELKARALARQGKTREADGVYAELQTKYPSYRSAQIERERKELAEKRKGELKERRRKPAKRSYDMAAPEAESEAAEPASQPSSIDVERAN